MHYLSLSMMRTLALPILYCPRAHLLRNSAIPFRLRILRFLRLPQLLVLAFTSSPSLRVNKVIIDTPMQWTILRITTTHASTEIAMTVVMTVVIVAMIDVMIVVMIDVIAVTAAMTVVVPTTTCGRTT